MWDVSFLAVQALVLGRPEIRHLNLHSSFTKRNQAGFRTHSFDVRARQILLGHDELLQVDIVSQTHLACVDAEDLSLSLLVREWELNLAVDTTWADQSRIKPFDLVRSHDDLHVAAGVEAVKLVQELKHRSLNFLLT